LEFPRRRVFFEKDTIMTIRWLSSVEEEGETLFRIGRDGDTYIAEWPELLTLRAAKETPPQVTEHEGLSPVMKKKILSGAVKAYTRHLTGAMSVHAAVLARNGRAIALLGTSGAGKSTLAAYLTRALGAELVSDDVCHLEEQSGRLIAPPAGEQHFLNEASCVALGLTHQGGAEKSALESPCSQQPYPLCAWVSLAFDTHALKLQPLHGYAALAAVLGSSARLTLDDPESTRRDLERAGRWATEVPVLRFVRPRDFNALSNCLALFSHLFEGTDPNSCSEESPS
jgi:hypothetical protein